MAPGRSLVARHALAIPHILDAVLGCVGAQSKRSVLALRRVCKTWNEAALADLASDVLFDGRCWLMTRPPSTAKGYTAYLIASVRLQRIFAGRPDLFDKVKHIRLSLDWHEDAAQFVQPASHILQTCSNLDSVLVLGDATMEAPLPKHISSGTRRICIRMPLTAEPQYSDRLQGLQSFQNLKHLHLVNCGFQAGPGEHVGQMLAPLGARLTILELDFGMLDDVTVQKVLRAALPHLQNLRKLTLRITHAVSFGILDQLPQSLLLLEVDGASDSLHSRLLRKLADPSFLPNLIRVPIVIQLPSHRESGHITKTMIHTVIRGLRQRSGVEDVESMKVSLYRLADDLTRQERRQLDKCEQEGAEWDWIGDKLYVSRPRKGSWKVS